jgi:hypothetical protein
LIEVPLSSLLDRNCFSEREIVEEGNRKVVYNFQYGQHAIWGRHCPDFETAIGIVTLPKNESLKNLLKRVTQN